jgi:heat shock protein HtpX
MYDQISSNKWKSWGLLLLFVAFVAGIAVVFGLAYRTPWIIPVVAGVAIIMAIGSYYNSDRIVLAMSGARPADGPEFAHLRNSVEGLAIAAGLPQPRVYVIDDSAPNAFATGRDPEHAVICVTTGLMDKMNRVELEGVVGHEMSHVKNYDIRFATLVVVLVGIVALLSDWFFRSMWWGGGRRRSSDDNQGGQGQLIWFVLAIVLAILAPISAALLQAALSRQR